MTQQFADRADAVEYLACHLRRGPLASVADDATGDAAHAIADAIVDGWGHSVTSDGGDSLHRATFRPARWVIRNQDLGLVDAVFGVLQATATGAALLASTRSVTLGLLAPAIAVLTSLVKIGLNLRNKGAQLSEREFFLLALVAAAPSGARSEALREDWTARFGEDAKIELESHLDRLAKYPSRMGELSLIWRDADGLWRAKDVQ